MWKRAYNRHVKSVMKSGIPARAEVLSAEESIAGGKVKVGSFPTGMHQDEIERDVSRKWKMDLQVVPEDRPAFELEVLMEIPSVMIPTRGTTLQVIYNPDQPQSIIVDPASVPKDLKDSLIAFEIDHTHAMGGDTTGMQEAADAATDPIAAASAAAAVARRNLMESLGPQSSTTDQSAVIEAQLEQLNQLKAAGALDAQTYEAARKRIIDSL